MSNGKNVTLKQVADAAGVSLKTASRVLAGEPYVAAATRAKVVSAAKSLGYQRNAAASLLASGEKADYITVITGDLTNPYYARLALGIEEQARERHMMLSLSSSAEDPSTEWELAQTAARQRSRALIVVSSMDDHSRYRDLQRSGMVVVFVDREAREIKADSVVLDDVEGGRLAAHHLLAQGHRDIAFIGDYEWLPTGRRRIQGFGEIMEAEGVPHWRDFVRTGAHDVEGARAIVRDLLEGPRVPTAFVAGNNRSSLAVLHEITGRDPAGQRSALIGFDDVEWASVLGMSVISCDPSVVGTEAVKLAFARMADPNREPRVVTVPLTLTARGSGERPPYSAEK